MRYKRVRILSPHHDDAAFSCALILQSLLFAGIPVQVVNVCTRSRYAPFFDGRADLEAVSAVRKLEDNCFADRLTSVAKVDRNMLEITDLGWMDAPVRWDMHEGETLRAHDLRGREVDSLAEELGLLGSADLVLAPLAVGGHVDHRLVRAAAFQSQPTAQLALYEELPYAARVEDQFVAGSGCVGPGGCQAGEKSKCNAWHWQEWTRRSYPPRPIFVPGMKEQYALCYPSQIDAGTAQEIGDYSDALGGRERLQGPVTVLNRLDELFHEI